MSCYVSLKKRKVASVIEFLRLFS